MRKAVEVWLKPLLQRIRDLPDTGIMLFKLSTCRIAEAVMLITKRNIRMIRWSQGGSREVGRGNWSLLRIHAVWMYSVRGFSWVTDFWKELLSSKNCMSYSRGGVNAGKSIWPNHWSINKKAKEERHSGQESCCYWSSGTLCSCNSDSRWEPTWFIHHKPAL